MDEKTETDFSKSKSGEFLYHTLPSHEAAFILGTNISADLDQNLISERIEKYGFNEFKGKGGISPWKIFFRQFANLMVLILIGAIVLSFIIKDIGEGTVLVIIIIANAAVGFFQEFKAEKTVNSLRKLTSPTSKVLRSGRITSIPTIELVPGDILLLESGDVVGADCRLFDTLNFETDEALLTGEALPVLKSSEDISDPDCPSGDRINIGYSSTLVTKGKSKGIVFATGMSSEIGKIALKLVETNGDRKSNLVRSLDNLSYCTLVAAIICVLIIFGVNRFKINGEVAIYAISLAIAVIPEGLLAVLTLTMALGVRQMTKQKALVRQLNALEIVGSVTDICSDKTGTLTQSKMVLVRGWIPEEGDFSVSGLGFEPFGDIHLAPAKVNSNSSSLGPNSNITSIHVSNDKHSDSFKKLAKISALCNMSEIKQEDTSGEWYGVGDPTEIALQVFSTKTGYGKQILEQGPESWVAECEFSFDSSVKRMTVVARNASNEKFAFMKGATERVVAACNRVLVGGEIKQISPSDLLGQVDSKITELASDGLRVISLAYRNIGATEFQGSADLWDRDVAERDMVYVGMVGIYDPPRPESKSSVERCFSAGIMVRMLTGDHPETAKAIAKQIGIIPGTEGIFEDDRTQIGTNSLVMTASQFDILTDYEIDQMEELPAVIARCTPDTKVKLIQALHRRNRVVAMTGDGVNDSPSLKSSDVGISMGITGSDVAKQASSIILTDDNFATIVAAVAEGRRLFTNIGKFIRCLIGTNVAGTICLMIGLVFKDVSGSTIFPLSPVAILVNNLVTRAPPAMALGTEKAPKDNMSKPPRNPKSGLFTGEVIADLTVYGIFIGSISILGFYLRLDVFGDGNLGINCNSKYNDTCYTVFKARGTNFANLTVLMMLFNYSCRSTREPTFSIYKLKDIYHNKYLFYSCWIGMIVAVLALYIPGLNTNIFKHLPIGLEWLIVLVSAILYTVFDALYKYTKSYFFKSTLENGTLY